MRCFFQPPRVWWFFCLQHQFNGDGKFKQKNLINISLCFSVIYLKIYANGYILDLNNKINKLLNKLSKYNII